MSDQQECYVRLKPYNPGIGNVRGNFRVSKAAGWSDFIFDNGEVVKVNADAAAFLADIRQRHLDHSSPLAFDIWPTWEECAAALRTERQSQLKRVMTPVTTLEQKAAPPLTVAETQPDFTAPPATHQLEQELMAATAPGANGQVPEGIDLSKAQVPDPNASAGDFDDLAHHAPTEAQLQEFAANNPDRLDDLGIEPTTKAESKADGPAEAKTCACGCGTALGGKNKSGYARGHSRRGKG